jgi:hypothetical protein
MITLSNFVILGIIEVYALFISGLLVLVVYNRSLTQRILRLRDQLIKLKKTPSAKASATASKIVEKSFLENEIDSASSMFASIAPDQDIKNYSGTDVPEQIASLRYKFLISEQNASKTASDKDKWDSLQDSLLGLVEQIKEQAKTEIQVSGGEQKADKLNENWSELCLAAVQLWDEKSTESEDNLMALFQVINSELGFDQLKIPERKSPSERRRQEYNKSVDTVIQLKNSANENKKLILSLLNQKDAAESEVSIKVDELQKLQRFLNESEVCIKLLEDEMEELRAQAENPTEIKELKDLIQNFAKESSEMLTCIETLENENAELRAQINAK